MEQTKPHLSLIELRNIVENITIETTNQFYSRGIKRGVKTIFSKGDKVIIIEKKEITDYYMFKLFILDKTDKNNVLEIGLYTAYYKPTSDNVFKIEETAIKDFLRTGVVSLINISLTKYYNEKELAEQRNSAESNTTDC